MWYEKITQIFKIKDLRNRIIFVLIIFALFRFLANIPMPGFNAEKLREFSQNFQLFGLANVFTGGAFDKFSIAMLGLGPYITATIILQLLTMIFPQLEKLYKEEGEQGRQKFNQYGRLLTVPLALLQSFAMLTLFQRQQIIPSFTPLVTIASIFTIAAGTVLLMWFGELISEKGIGNGVSLLIFAGIVADFPNNIYQIVSTWDPTNIPAYILFFGMSLFIIIPGVVLINEARRNIPISYAKRVRGNRMFGGASTYLPLNVNPAGVIPIIFALSILLAPGMLANFLKGASGWLGTAAGSVANFFDPGLNPIGYGIVYFALVAIFTYFYTAVTFDPKSVSANLQKMGGFIPGIRPGESTAHFLNYILNRVLLIGALFLGIVAVLPSTIATLTNITSFRFLVGGTSLLIAVSVVLETMRQINAQLQMREYDTF